jgi:IS5 family transposase
LKELIETSAKPIYKFVYVINILYLYGMVSHTSDYSFADLLLSRRKVKENFFSQINKVIDWSPIRVIIERAYTKGKVISNGGRPAYDSLVLFRIEMLRTWYGLSDGDVEDQVNDRVSFSRFAGISLEDVVPDSTTICRFRNLLVSANLYDDILNEFNRQLELAGVIVKNGAIIDASITDSPRRPRGKKEYIAVVDRNEDSNSDEAEQAFLIEKEKPNVDKEARWIYKMGRYRFGFKRHTVTDLNGLIIAEQTTSANESDITHLQVPIEKSRLPDGVAVLADKGYYSANNRKVLADNKLKSRIMHKATKSRKLTQMEHSFNAKISKTRYKVERTFGSIHLWFRGGTARYVGLAKTHAQHIMEAIAYNLYRTPGIIVSNALK